MIGTGKTDFFPAFLNKNLLIAIKRSGGTYSLRSLWYTANNIKYYREDTKNEKRSGITSRVKHGLLLAFKIHFRVLPFGILLCRHRHLRLGRRHQPFLHRDRDGGYGGGLHPQMGIPRNAEFGKRRHGQRSRRPLPTPTTPPTHNFAPRAFRGAAAYKKRLSFESRFFVSLSAK